MLADKLKMNTGREIPAIGNFVARIGGGLFDIYMFFSVFITLCPKNYTLLAVARSDSLSLSLSRSLSLSSSL